MCVWSWIPECVQNEMRENIEEIKIKQQSQIDAWWQKADESWREQKDCGNDEEHSRSLELQLGFPLRAVFLQILPSASFSYVLHVALYTDMYTQSSLPFKSNTCSILPTLRLWLCVCVCVFVKRYCVWQVDWSVWSWKVSQTQLPWRSRTSLRVTLRRNGCQCFCPQQSL